jgi:hypothetical protein
VGRRQLSRADHFSRRPISVGSSFEAMEHMRYAGRAQRAAPPIAVRHGLSAAENRVVQGVLA